MRPPARRRASSCEEDELGVGVDEEDVDEEEDGKALVLLAL